MIDIRFSVFGPGRVGGSLAHWLVACGGHLEQVATRRRSAAERLCDSLGGSAVAIEEITTTGEDLLLLAVSDPALEAVAHDLAARSQADVVLHVAGAMPAEVLAPLRQVGSAIGSLHPLRAFPAVEPDPQRVRGTYFAIDGDPAAIEISHRLLDIWQAHGVEIPPRHRRLYHLAASLAAGGVVTILAMVRQIIDRVGLPPEVERGYFALARQALAEAVAEDHPRNALTGPAARGDVELVERQLAELEATAPELVDGVVALLEETRRASAARAADDSAWEELGRILAKAKQRKSFLDP
ncbi:MAG: Rossmann-like and DUF2520 domain-containing protein [Thermoanaerobaculia bacterium]|nr:Rossmann-like and DUF2520 domain-containing protein [Thermoanaerobaculia bacterium]